MNRTTAPTLSIELFPPKDEKGEEKLWAAIERLREIHPDFVSVTYGAGGSTRDRTIRIAEEFTAKTGISTVAHLTCVGSTRTELLSILDHYQASGISSILALRGDPTGGPRANWVSYPDGFDHADQLVELAAEFGGFSIGVAAFPDGHPNSNGNHDLDIQTLVRKAKLGATFATSQFFFEVAKWSKLVEDLSKHGVTIPIYPGVLPITNVKQLIRMTELSKTPIPQSIKNKIEAVSENDVIKVGVEIATDFCEQLLNAGAPGLHFYTLNLATPTRVVCERLGLSS